MILVLLLMGALLLFSCPSLCFAAYTPLISTSDFDGIKADVLTTSAGIITILLVIVGLGILVKVLGR